VGGSDNWWALLSRATRMAIGAHPAQVVRLIEIQSVDPNLAVTGTTPFVSYMSASWLPARRASRIDPVETLRWE
jgi:ABC-type lipoprotein release transport system permease subunit